MADDDFSDEAPTNPPQRWDPDARPPLDLDPAEMRFLDQIRDDPQDAPLRAVYADWLEQRGELARAELVRLLSAAPTDRSPERARIRELGATQPNDWMAILSCGPIDGCEQALRRPCTQRWEALAVTEQPRVRHCEACGHQVQFCASLDGVLASAEDDRVAYSPLLHDHDAVRYYDGRLFLDMGRRERERRARRLRPFES